MTVVRIIAGLIHAILRIFAEALKAGLGIAFIGVAAIVILIGLAVAALSSLGVLGIASKRRNHHDDAP